MSDKIKIYIGLTLLAGGSFGAGYFAAIKKTEKEIERQVKAAKAYYAQQYKKDGYESPQSALETLREEGELFTNAVKGMADYQTVKEGGELPEEDEVRIVENVENTSLTLEGPRRRVMPQKEDLDDILNKLEQTGGIKKRNIFADPRPPAAVEHEHEGADEPKRPYLVSQEIFTEPSEEYTLQEYTMFAGDNTVANDQDKQLDDAEVDRIIGEENLNHFGYLEDDPHVILVRNDELMLNIEVTLVETKFGEKVAGFMPEGDGG